MWPRRELCELLQIEHPIIQAPMVGSCTPALAAAVSNAGAMGSLGMGEKSLAEAEAAITDLQRATNRPVNINFFIRAKSQTKDTVLQKMRQHLAPWYDQLGLGEPPSQLPILDENFTAEKLDLVCRTAPAVVSFHFGLPDADAMAALKEANIKILSTATNVAEAVELEQLGVDAIIAQGFEAGGHRGSHELRPAWDAVGGLALIPQIVDAVSLPVIAAGGIGDGRGIAAAFALGAAGVQMGTAFLSTPEAATDAARRQLLEDATEQETMMTAMVSGRPARARRSKFTEEMDRVAAPPTDFIQQYALTRPIIAASDDDTASFHLYGQAARLNRDLPAADLVQALAEEAAAVFAAMRSD